MAWWTDRKEQKRIFTSVFADAQPDQYFFIMVILSCTVATYGLLSNSTAVVIGAMLIAPLMGPILGGALGIATHSNDVLKLSAKAEALGAITSIVLAAVLTLILPRTDLTQEIMARTTPTILDLVIALASGAAGTYAICMKPQAATLPGVAIATALMPPLCVVGIGLAKQDFSVMSGALLLFLANMIAINVAAIALFTLAGFSSTSSENEEAPAGKNRRLFYPVLLLALISIPLAFIMFQTYTKANMEKIIKSSLAESLEVIAPHSTLISADYKDLDNQILVNAAFRTTTVMTPENIRHMENLLELRLARPIALKADVVLVQKVNNKESVDSFRQLLPKIKEREIVEVVKTSTPEDIIESVVREKISLFPTMKLEDFSLEYRNSTSTYVVRIKLTGTTAVDEKLSGTIQKILEERLNRRVAVYVEMQTDLPPSVVKPSSP